MSKVYGYTINNVMPIVEYWTAEYDGKNINQVEPLRFVQMASQNTMNFTK